MFSRFQMRFSYWSPIKRVSFVLFFYFLFACIPMLLVWVFPPPIIVTSIGITPPTLALGTYFSIAIPVTMVVLSVFATNIVFSSSEDPKYYLRVITLIICIEVAMVVFTVANAAHAYWFGIFSPILEHPTPIEPFPGAWLISSIDYFFLAHVGLFPLLLIAGGAVILITFICENII